MNRIAHDVGTGWATANSAGSVIEISPSLTTIDRQRLAHHADAECTNHYSGGDDFFHGLWRIGIYDSWKSMPHAKAPNQMNLQSFFFFS
ncbi:MAG: hypothetical protein ABW125_21225 [Candidatus Thiodiazotropha lotti]|nr:hypothetical protein [Candidatus Thiodiazotropha lotti]MCG8010121.1 hypothetical protein [Candidatus Thiodiazotropha lotti]MCW4209579.1 hypothetical protein [Candidatus Thiodiazotropha lotti]MCW4215259.1 hypothetical protein [Candidatus Thiodiazotropha lotti]